MSADADAAAIQALADHLSAQRQALLATWADRVMRDASLTSGSALTRAQLTDHIPNTLDAFERRLRRTEAAANHVEPEDGTTASGAHGIHRWQQGYDLREVTRELGHLNAVLVAALDTYALARPHVPGTAMALARGIWAGIHSAEVEDSTHQFFKFQRSEAEGQVEDLETTLTEVSRSEEERARLWHQLAHDLRGNVGVVATATKALTLRNAPAESRERFIMILERNVESLRHLLDDVTALTRLQAGKEARQIVEVDVATVLARLCDGLQALAEQRELYLRYEREPQPLWVQGDAVKIRRLAQNLILNALKYTQVGGVEVSWSAGSGDNAKRWILVVEDTGPGLHAGPGAPVATALKVATEVAHAPSASRGEAVDAADAGTSARLEAAEKDDPRQVYQAHGEGIGLSIVKRLGELLDAAIEVESEAGKGTTFKILLPLSYGEPGA